MPKYCDHLTNFSLLLFSNACVWCTPGTFALSTLLNTHVTHPSPGNSLYSFRVRKEQSEEDKQLERKKNRASDFGSGTREVGWSNVVYVGQRLVPVELVPAAEDSFDVTWSTKDINQVAVGSINKFYIIVTSLLSKKVTVIPMAELPETCVYRVNKLPADRYRVRLQQCVVFSDEESWLRMRQGMCGVV